MTTSSTTGAAPITDSDRMVPIGHLVDVCARLRRHEFVGTRATEAAYRHHWPTKIERPDGYGDYFPLLVDTVSTEDQRGCVPLNTGAFRNNHPGPKFPDGRPIWWYVAWVRIVGKGVLPMAQDMQQIKLRPGEEWLTVNEARMWPMQYPDLIGLGKGIYLFGSRPERPNGCPYPLLYWTGHAAALLPKITTVSAQRMPRHGRLAAVRGAIVTPVFPKPKE